MQKNKNNVKEIMSISLRLVIICAFIAVLVASVNFLTKDKIDLNQKIKTAQALTQINKQDGLIFGVDSEGAYTVKDFEGNTAGFCREAQIELLSDIDALYVIEKADGSEYGYCIEASPMGFKDEVGMLIAINPDKTVKAVSIVSLKETKGIGDKVSNGEYLKKFEGKTRGFSSSYNELKKTGMIIAGATRTSEPVSKAIDIALEQIDIFLNGGEENE